MKKPINELIILGIDTSCDETSVSVLQGSKVLVNLLPSQMEYHREFGGVVPSLARLAHEKRIDNVVNKALMKAGNSITDVDAIAVTYGPGLAIALEVGINKAKYLAEEYSKPLVVVNHMEGHLLSSLVRRNTENEVALSIEFPIIGFLISGGHTELVLMSNFGEYKKIGETLDDSCGEAYDKCGRMLGLGYPAGPIISRFSKENRENMSKRVFKKDKSLIVELTNKGSSKVYTLPVPMANSGDLNFSFSGLKTAFSQLVSLFGENLEKQEILDLCVTFESAAIEQLTLKLKLAIEEYKPREIWLGGGVVASAFLRSEVRKSVKGIRVRYPFSSKLTGDNAAMIALVANYRISRLGINHNPQEGIFLKDYHLIDREPTLDFVM
jgi:N6-L-threonylcarbamoyladenine synthase